MFFSTIYYSGTHNTKVSFIILVTPVLIYLFYKIYNLFNLKEVGGSEVIILVDIMGIKLISGGNFLKIMKIKPKYIKKLKNGDKCYLSPMYELYPERG